MRHARGAVWPVARWAAGRRRRGAAALRKYDRIRACDTPEFPIGTPGALINKLPVLARKLESKKRAWNKGSVSTGFLHVYALMWLWPRKVFSCVMLAGAL